MSPHKRRPQAVTCALTPREIFTLGRGKPASDGFLIELADLVENYVPESIRRRLDASGAYSVAKRMGGSAADEAHDIKVDHDARAVYEELTETLADTISHRGIAAVLLPFAPAAGLITAFMRASAARDA